MMNISSEYKTSMRTNEANKEGNCLAGFYEPQRGESVTWVCAHLVNSDVRWIQIVM